MYEQVQVRPVEQLMRPIQMHEQTILTALCHWVSVVIYYVIPVQYSCLENPMDGGAWWAAVYGVTRSWTPLSDFTFTFHFHALEKEMATHSSVFAWRILGMGEPGGLLSMGSHRVGHDWSDLAAARPKNYRWAKMKNLITQIMMKIILGTARSLSKACLRWRQQGTM